MIEIHDLCKSYGRLAVLDHLNFTLKSGELFGFVGPNGAGKTTTMRIMSGLLKADSGSVYIDELDIEKDIISIKQKIGYMPDFFGVYDNLKVMEYMKFYASLYGITGKNAQKLCMELLDMVSMRKKADSFVDELSRGMKQKLCLARCMVHNPKLLILDEPCSGLDLRARNEMHKIMRNLNNRGKTIIISSHILSELSELCTTIGIIDNGKMIAKGTIDEIMMHFNAANPIKIHVLSNKAKAIELFKADDMVKSILIEGDKITIGYIGNEEDEAKLLQKIIYEKIKVASFAREKGNLENLFLKVTEIGGGTK